MGFFDSIMGGLFGTDPEGQAAFPDELKQLIEFGLAQGNANAGMGTAGFNQANTLMPLLLEQLGIKAITDKSGNVTGYDKIVDPNQAAKDKLETTTLKNLQMYAEGRGAVPVGVSERNKAARQNLKGGLRRAGFQRGDTPFDMAMNKLRTGIRETNDAFRHGQFGVASGLLNQLESSGRADLQTFLSGATSTQQSPLPWLQSLVGNTAAISGYSSAGIGGGKTEGQSGLLGDLLGSFIASPAGSAAIAGMVCWVARAVYGDDNPDWLLFRRWMIVKAPLWFGNLYRFVGPSLGRLIRKCPAIGTMLKPFMDKVL